MQCPSRGLGLSRAESILRRTLQDCRTFASKSLEEAVGGPSAHPLARCAPCSSSHTGQYLCPQNCPGYEHRSLWEMNLSPLIQLYIFRCNLLILENEAGSAVIFFSCMVHKV